MGKKPREPSTPPPAPFHAPFEGLRAKLGLPAEPVARSGQHVAAPTPAPAAKPAPPRAVVRFERKGRGGKAVTIVDKLGLGRRELEAWLGELKRALGCGGTIEGDALVLQGDLRERVRTLLEVRGVRKVTVG